MPKKYHVRLTDEERAQLGGMLGCGVLSARTLVRAQVLLHADAGLTDRAIAGALAVATGTAERVRRRFLSGGLEGALHDRPRPGAPRKLDGEAEALLVAWAGSAPPGNRARWSMQGLADRLVEAQVVESISDETVRRVLREAAARPA